MKNILRQTLSLILFSLFWYAITIFLSYGFYPVRPYYNTIGAELATDNIFQTETRDIIFNLPKFAFSPEKKIFLLGSSNAQLGFRPDELRQFLSGYEIHNMAIDGTNITEMAEEVGLIMELIPPEIISKSIFVLGVSYNVFVDDKSRWNGGYSNLSAEATRYKLYKLKEGRIVPAVDKKIIPCFVSVLRPFLFINGFTLNLTRNIDNVKTIIHKLSLKKKFFLKNDLKIIIYQFLIARHLVEYYPEVNEAFKKGALKNWDGYINAERGTLKNEQFEKLMVLCRSISESEAGVVIFDMPLPQWHRRGSPYYADYRRKMNFYISDALKLENVRYLDASDIFDDGDFYDSIHPFHSATKKFSKFLGSFIL